MADLVERKRRKHDTVARDKGPGTSCAHTCGRPEKRPDTGDRRQDRDTRGWREENEERRIDPWKRGRHPSLSRGHRSSSSMLGDFCVSTLSSSWLLQVHRQPLWERKSHYLHRIWKVIASCAHSIDLQRGSYIVNSFAVNDHACFNPSVCTARLPGLRASLAFQITQALYLLALAKKVTMESCAHNPQLFVACLPPGGI